MAMGAELVLVLVLLLFGTVEEAHAKPLVAETESSVDATAALSKLLNPRRALQRDGWFSAEDEGKCMNTVQGELLLTDDRGYVCPVEDIDTTTGCCLRGTGPHTCAGCDMKSKCCILYETCVSCCMHPKEKASERMGNEYRVRHRSSTGHFDTAFEFCRGMCRTTKDCTLHENGYRSDFKYCFNEDGVPPKVFPRDPLPNKHVEVISADKGQTCTDACLKTNMNCSHRLLEQINTCDEMKTVRYRHVHSLVGNGCLSLFSVSPIARRRSVRASQGQQYISIIGIR